MISDTHVVQEYLIKVGGTSAHSIVLLNMLNPILAILYISKRQRLERKNALPKTDSSSRRCFADGVST